MNSSKPKHKVLIWAEEQVMDKAEFLEAFKKVLEVIQKIKQTNEETAIHLKNIFGLTADKIEKNYQSDLTEIKNWIRNELQKYPDTINSKIKEADEKLGRVKDGRDADEENVIKRVLSHIRLPELYEESIPKRIKEKLEQLQGNERLDLASIKGLTELIKELEDKISSSRRLGGGGGFSKIAMLQYFIDDETPSGTKNGVNTDFTLVRIPSTGSLKVYRGGARQRITEDYTLSGKTITFIVPPTAGEIILCDYIK